MSTQVEAGTVEAEEVESTETVADDTNGDTGSDDVESQEPEVEDPTAGLKSALQKERATRKELEKKLKAHEREAAVRDMAPDERVIDEARREAAAEAMKGANLRIVRAEFRSVAKERGLDPNTAARLADLESVELDDDGNVDPDSLTAALDAVVTEHPTLVPPRFQGTADQGARGRDAGPAQMSQSEFDRIKHDYRAVKKAKDEGRLNTLLGFEA